MTRGVVDFTDRGRGRGVAARPPPVRGGRRDRRVPGQRTSLPSPRPKARTGTFSSRRCSARSWSTICRAIRCIEAGAGPADEARGSRATEDDALVRQIRELIETRVRPGGRAGRRRHHLPRLRARRRLSAHARLLQRLPELDHHAQERHRESAPLLRAGGGRGAPGRLDRQALRRRPRPVILLALDSAEATTSVALWDSARRGARGAARLSASARRTAARLTVWSS